MKRACFRELVLALTAITYWTSAAASAEKWFCDMEMSKGKTYKQEWIVFDDAVELEKRKVETPRGGSWHPQLIKRILQRLELP